MKKFYITLLVLVIILVAGIYFGSGFIFDKVADKMLPHFLPRLAERGVNIENYDFSSINLVPPRTITISDVRTSFELDVPNLNRKFPASFYAEKVNFHITNLKDPTAFISCDNFQLYVDRSADFPGTSFGRFENGFVKLRDPIRLKDPQAGLKLMMQKLSDAFNEKDVDPNVDVRANVTLNVRDKEAQAYLYTTRDENGASLRFEEKDIRQMADTFDLELSDEEVAIIAQYPVRAPIIMRITSDAKDTSKEAHRRNSSVPEDAYRHVLWSFLLTKKFGPEFAEKVTDAHETLPTNTAAERAMDFNNNRVGREFAQQGVKRERILSLVKSHRDVIRYPEG
jgi:hypothetical protein